MKAETNQIFYCKPETTLKNLWPTQRWQSHLVIIPEINENRKPRLQKAYQTFELHQEPIFKNCIDKKVIYVIDFNLYHFTIICFFMKLFNTNIIETVKIILNFDW